MPDFQGMTVMITGAAAGIGRCLAGAYADAGCHLVLVDRNRGELEHAAKGLGRPGLQILPLPCDLSRAEEIAGVFAALARKKVLPDILVNNAGLGRGASPLELSLEDWDYVLNTNLRGTFLCTRELAKLLQAEGKGGSVVNIASTRALMSEADTEAYSASKGGILALTHAMAVSLGELGIRVNAVSPGWIETGDYEALTKEDHAQHPAMRVGRPEDIAAACFYLTDPANSFVTGANLVVDGGMTKKMIYVE